jgi:nicotinamidase-related amidase
MLCGVSSTALIVIDMINLYEHADADRLVRSVRGALPGIERLLGQARDTKTLTIYVNDTVGSWTSNADDLVRRVLDGPHADLVKPVVPDEQALLVIKVRHSIFYQTPLEYLLQRQEVTRLVLCGQVTEQCVLYSALDAHIRHLEVAVARDAVAHIHPDLAAAALRMMEFNMGADVCDSDAIRLQP